MVKAAQESVTLTTNQYKAGTVNYLNVVTVQATTLTNESTAVNILGRRMTASVLLIKALGGGWSVRPTIDQRGDGAGEARQEQVVSRTAASAPSKRVGGLAMSRHRIVLAALAVVSLAVRALAAPEDERTYDLPDEAASKIVTVTNLAWPSPPGSR